MNAFLIIGNLASLALAQNAIIFNTLIATGHSKNVSRGHDFNLNETAFDYAFWAFFRP